MFSYEKDQKKKEIKKVLQKKAGVKSPAANATGIPEQMKLGFENHSGLSFDNVRVDYYSDKPARVNALAYTQGNRVFIGPGQERHLGHELGHVVQQKLGMVQSTGMVGGLAYNDSPRLEREADRIAVQSKYVAISGENNREARLVTAGENTPVQRKIGMEFQTFEGEWNIKKLKSGRTTSQAEVRGKDSSDKETVSLNMGSLEPAGRDEIEKFRQSKFTITGDGSDLEYITEAFDERTEKAKLVNAAKKAGNIHKSIREGSLQIPRVETSLIGNNFYRLKKGEDYYYINKNGESTAHPQATIGVRITAIPKLIEDLSKQKKDSYLRHTNPRGIRLTKQFGEINRMTLKKTSGSTVAVDTRAFIQLVEHYIRALEPPAVIELRDEIRVQVQKNANALPVSVEVTETLYARIPQLIEKAKKIKVATGTTDMAAYAENIIEQLGSLSGEKEENAKIAKAIMKELNEILPENKRVGFTLGKAADNEKKMKAALGKIPAEKVAVEKECDRAMSERELLRTKREEAEAEISEKQSSLEEEISRSEKTFAEAPGKKRARIVSQREKTLKASLVILEKRTGLLSRKLNKNEAKVNDYNEKIIKMEAAIANKQQEIDEYVAAHGEIVGKINDQINAMNSLREDMKKGAEQFQFPKVPVEDASLGDREKYIESVRLMFEQVMQKYPYLEECGKIETEIDKFSINRVMTVQKYHKTVLALKSRTSFFDMYNLLSAEGKSSVEEYFHQKYDAYTLIYDDISDSIPLFRWLDELKKNPGGHDSMSYELENAGKLTDRKDYFEKFGVSRSTDIGQDEGTTKVEGVLLELRQLKRKVVPEKWGNVANAVGELVNKVNGT